MSGQLLHLIIGAYILRMIYFTAAAKNMLPVIFCQTDAVYLQFRVFMKQYRSNQEGARQSFKDFRLLLCLPHIFRCIEVRICHFHFLPCHDHRGVFIRNMPEDSLKERPAR